MWPQSASIFSILPLLIFFSASNPSALPSHIPQVSDIDISENHQSYHRHETKVYDSPRRRDVSLASRTVYELGAGFQSFIDIGLGWNMYYSSWHASSLPIQPAAWALTNLYAAIMTQSQSSWRKGPSQKLIKANIGQIQLLMFSERAIPWNFVEKFSTKMLSITQGGWTGLYQVLLSQAGSDMTIVVELSILPWK